jgi:uncharacterized membrane protein YdjX (TVP38/TMEM64 family)
MTDPAPVLASESSPHDTQAAATATATATKATDDADLRAIIKGMVLGVVGLFVGVTLILWLFKEPLDQLSVWFIDTLGPVGVMLGYFLPDAFIIPIPNAAFAFFGLSAGLGFWEMMFWCSLGGVAGGCVAFLVGRRMQHTRWFKVLMMKRGRQINRLFQRFGSWALGIAALFPSPFWLACWTVGAGGMSFQKFFVISLLRIPKFAGYLWLIRQSIEITS